MKPKVTIILTSALGVLLTGCAPSPNQADTSAQKVPQAEVVTEESMSNKLMADRSQLDDDERKLVEDVENVGWHVIAIEEDDEGPGFAYIIGLHHSFDHPEVIVFGLRTESLFQIINTIGESVRDGAKFESDHESDDVLNDGRIVSLETILKMDGTTAELADLPVGWMASRDAPGKPWQRYEADK